MEKGGELSALQSLIERSKHISVITHEHPDGDAAGSSGALVHYLKYIGKTYISLIREPLADTIAFIDRQESLFGEQAINAIEKSDLIFCCDFCVLERCGQPYKALKDSHAVKVLLDHHVRAENDEFELAFSRTDISSACEMVYEILRELCPDEKSRKDLFSGQCGYCLMCGMTTDTNNFSCATFPSTFNMASQLLSYGIDRDDIIANLYNNYRENRVRAFANFLSSDRFTIREDGLAIIKVSALDWHTFGLKEGELEGLVNVPLSIGKVKVTIYFREDEMTIRVSIRAKRGWSARRIAQKYFNGGGHELASGGKLFIGKDIHSFSEIDKYVEKIEL